MTGRFVFVSWLCFVAQGVFYATVMPLWDGFDEFSHYAFLEDIAIESRLTLPDRAFISKEVADSLRASPVPWMIRTWQPDWISYDRYWTLSHADRTARLARLRSLSISGESDPARIRDYEAQQPPLAYAVLIAPFRLFDHIALPDRVWALRISCVLIASALIPFTFLAVREATGNEWQAVAGASLACAFPEIFFYTARLANDALAVALGSALVWLLIRNCAAKHTGAGLSFAIGAVLGCALLTKAYFLPIGIAAAGIVIAAPAPLRLRLKRTAFSAGIPMLIAGWWYARAYALTSSITGEQTASAAIKSGMLGSMALHASWLRILDFALISHIWLGGWSFLVVRAWMYRAVEILLAVAVVGIIRNARSLTAPVRAALFIEAAFLIVFALHAVASTMGGGSGAFGYYAFAIFPAEIICLIAGWNSLGKTPSRFAPFATTLALTAVAIFGLVIYAIPYWSGIIAHNLSGSLRAIPARQILSAFSMEMRHLAWGRPVGFILAGWAVFVPACLANCALSWFALSAMSRQDSSASRLARPAPVADQADGSPRR